MLDQLSAEHHCAYLITDRALRVQSMGGYLTLFGNHPPRVGDALLDLFPELIGNESVLYDIMAGSVQRLHLPHINRDSADGRTRYLTLLTLPYFDATGRIQGLLQAITDVTEQGIIEQMHVQQRNELRLLRDRLKQQNIELARVNAELRRAHRQKDEFLAGISHEVRTPLSAILGLAELLRTEIIGPLTDEQKEMVSRIEESGRHLLAVINDLLDLAKIEAGRVELAPQMIAAHDLCRAGVRMIYELAMRKSQTVRTNLDPRVEGIYGDERRLRQALINLLSNAVKFTPPEGQIGIDLAGDPDNEAVRISVWDTGIGIAAEDMPRLFQPFSQIDNVYQRDQAGSGLGLVIVARLAELHGGGVTLVSEPGKGSRFTITLPWTRHHQMWRLTSLDAHEHESPRSDLPDEESFPQACGNDHILLIDDDVKGSAVIGDYLRHCGYRVTHVVSGEEGLALARHEPLDIAIVDLRLRGLDGLEVIRRLRAGIAASTLPIIALTALAMPGDRERSLEAGADVYLSKPVRLRRLAEEVAALLQRNPAQQQ